MAQRFLSIKNFEKYQHYKHRNPPWVKLHLSLLDDPDFLRLPDASKWHYVGLILLASRHENAIQDDKQYISNRLGLSTELTLNHRYLRDHVLAPRKHFASTLPTNADSETEKSRDRVETETETEVDAFLRVYQLYPRKVGKQAAKKAWDRLNGLRPSLDFILDAITAQSSTEQWQKDGGKFIPHLATWLNGKRWEDEVSVQEDWKTEFLKDEA